MKIFIRLLFVVLGTGLLIAGTALGQTSEEELILEYQEFLDGLQIEGIQLTREALVDHIEKHYALTLIERILKLPADDQIVKLLQDDYIAGRTDQPPTSDSQAPEQGTQDAGQQAGEGGNGEDKSQLEFWRDQDLFREAVAHWAADQILTAASKDIDNVDAEPALSPIGFATLQSIAKEPIAKIIRVNELFPELTALPQPKGSEGPTVLDRMAKVVSVRRSFLDKKQIGKPALLSWVHFSEKDASRTEDNDKYDIRGALIFDLTPDKSNCEADDKWCSSYEPVLVYEANFSTDESDKRDTITHRFGLQAFWGHQGQDSPGLMNGHGLILTADYQTDRDYRSEVLGATLQYSPTAIQLGIGRYRSAGKLIHWRWQPYVGLVYGDVQDPGNSEQLAMRESYTRANLRLTLELLFGERLKLTATETLDWELEGENESHDHLSLSAAWSLDSKDRASLVATFNNGELAPLFQRAKNLSVSLGFKL